MLRVVDAAANRAREAVRTVEDYVRFVLDDRHLRYQVEAFAGAPHGDRIWPGLGTWLFARSPARALDQLELVRQAGAAGDALFSYDAIADAPALLATLARGRVPVAAVGDWNADGHCDVAVAVLNWAIQLLVLQENRVVAGWALPSPGPGPDGST